MHLAQSAGIHRRNHLRPRVMKMDQISSLGLARSVLAQSCTLKFCKTWFNVFIFLSCPGFGGKCVIVTMSCWNVKCEFHEWEMISFPFVPPFSFCLFMAKNQSSMVYGSFESSILISFLFPAFSAQPNRHHMDWIIFPAFSAQPNRPHINPMRILLLFLHDQMTPYT